MPNLRELESLVDLQNVYPSVSPAFNTACETSCAVLTCSCTRSDLYWSSSTYADNPVGAWSVYCNAGLANVDSKTKPHSVRAVRGGA